MIVADTNVIAYLLIDGERSDAARALWEKDQDWRTTNLWEDEFVNVLSTYGKAGALNRETLTTLLNEAIQLFKRRQLPVNLADALVLAIEARISAYDAQFVVLSQTLGVPLVTADKKLAQKFPEMTIDLARLG